MPIPNELTDRYRGKARQRGIYLQTGTFLEVDPRWPGHVFNTTCLIGPDGLLSRYPQGAIPGFPGKLHTSPHDLPGYDEPLFPVVETEIGRLGRGDLLRLAVSRGDPRAWPWPARRC